MKLTNQQIHDALDYCVKQVEEGKVWVCLKFEDGVRDKFSTGDDFYEFEEEFKKFGRLVQEFLREEYQKLHRADPPHEALDAETCLAGPEDSIRNVKGTDAQELRLRMIEWLRTQYPLETGHELWNADPNCSHDVIDAPGGGIKCTKCSGWFCY